MDLQPEPAHDQPHTSFEDRNKDTDQQKYLHESQSQQQQQTPKPASVPPSTPTPREGHTLNPRAPEFHSQSPIPARLRSPSHLEITPETVPIYPYAHRVNTRALIIDDTTGEDIEFNLPVYICVAQHSPAYGLRYSARSWYEQGRSARVMANWRGGGHVQTRRAGNGGMLGNLMRGDGGDQYIMEGSERSGRSRPWRRGMGLSRGLVRGDGGGRGNLCGGQEGGVVVGIEPEGDWVQVEHKSDGQAGEVDDGAAMKEDESVTKITTDPVP